jgi:transient receptor potential cation channel subfamily M protein 2
MATYFDSVWNCVDTVLYCLLLVSIIIRYSLTEYSFEWARRIYAVNLAMFFLRFLHTFFVDRNIGPKVIMIRRMVSENLTA